MRVKYRFEPKQLEPKGVTDLFSHRLYLSQDRAIVHLQPNSRKKKTGSVSVSWLLLLYLMAIVGFCLVFVCVS